MDKGLISCVLPTYNGEEYLAKAIQSVINQSYKNWELIVVNDASTDKTGEIIQHFANKDARIKYFKNATNQKLPRSLNIGFSKAKGEFFTWTSDDNEFKENAFEKMFHFLSLNPNIGFVYCDYDVWNSGQIFECIAEDNLLKLFLCSFGSCFLYRSSVAREVGDYNTKRFLAEDHDYFLRLSLACEIAHLKENLYLHRQHNANLSFTKIKDAAKVAFEVRYEFAPIFLKRFPQLYSELDIISKLKLYAITLNDEIYQNLPANSLKNIGGRGLRKSNRFMYDLYKHYYKVSKKPIYLRLISNLSLYYKLKAYLLAKKDLD